MILMDGHTPVEEEADLEEMVEMGGADLELVEEEADLEKVLKVVLMVEEEVAIMEKVDQDLVEVAEDMEMAHLVIAVRLLELLEVDALLGLKAIDILLVDLVFV